MNAQEFAALRPGDIIANGAGEQAEVTHTNPAGIHVRWKGTAMQFVLARMSTVWYGFEVVKSEPSTELGPHQGGA